VALRRAPPVGGGFARGGFPALGRLLLETALDVGGLFGPLGRCLRPRPTILT
jgi:hypothetical protein